MIQFAKENIILFILIHIAFGFLAEFSFFPKLFAFLVIIVAISVVLFSNNKQEEAFIMATYIVGIEVFLRMVKGAPLFETGKYTTIILLFIGLFIGPTKQKLTLAFPLYMLLLLLGIAFTVVPVGESIRKAVAFNLSGPFMLGICAIYFYKRRITFNEIYLASLFFIFPTFSMVTYMYLYTPDLSEINPSTLSHKRTGVWYLLIIIKSYITHNILSQSLKINFLIHNFLISIFRPYFNGGSAANNLYFSAK